MMEEEGRLLPLLVQPHLDSFADFLEVGLPRILSQQPIEISPDCIVHVGGKGDRRAIFYEPPTLEDRRLVPNECRLRKMTYALSVYADLDLDLTVWLAPDEPDPLLDDDEDDKKRGGDSGNIVVKPMQETPLEDIVRTRLHEELARHPAIVDKRKALATFLLEDDKNKKVQKKLCKTLKRVFLGHLPLVVQSEWCILHSLTPDMRVGLGERRDDVGGYIILDGEEKGSPLGLEMPSGTTTSLLLSMNEFGQIFIHGKPLFSVFRALGIESDKAIVECIVLDMDAHDDLVDALYPSVICAAGTADICLEPALLLDAPCEIGDSVFQFLCRHVRGPSAEPVVPRIRGIGAQMHDWFRNMWAGKDVQCELKTILEQHQSNYENNLYALVADHTRVFAWKEAWPAPFPLDRSSPLATIHQLRSLSTAAAYSSYGYIDPFDQSLALSATVTREYADESLLAWCVEHWKIKAPRDFPPRLLSNLTKVRINGKWVGVVENPMQCIALFHTWRRSDRLPATVSCTFSMHQHIDLWCDAGRLVRPLLFSPKKREWLDEYETFMSYIHPSEGTHSEIHPSFFLGYAMHHLTFSEHQPADDIRKTLTKMTTTAAAALDELPLVTSQIIRQIPLGQNIIVAIAGGRGDYVNHGSIDRGLFFPTQSASCFFRSGGNGASLRSMRECDVPFLSDGTRPDVVLSELSSVAFLYELFVGKFSAMMGGRGNATPFDNAAYDSLGGMASLFSANGFHSSGNTLLYDGTTGMQIEAEIFVGVAYALEQTSPPPIVRSTGTHDALTRQALPAVVAEESDILALLGHGVTGAVTDTLMDRGDGAWFDVCRQSGALALTTRTGAVFSQAVDGPVRFLPMSSRVDMQAPAVREFSRVRLPGAFRVLSQELQTVGVQLRLVTDDQMDPWQRMETPQTNNNNNKTELMMARPKAAKPDIEFKSVMQLLEEAETKRPVKTVKPVQTVQTVQVEVEVEDPTELEKKDDQPPDGEDSFQVGDRVCLQAVTDGYAARPWEIIRKGDAFYTILAVDVANLPIKDHIRVVSRTDMIAEPPRLEVQTPPLVQSQNTMEPFQQQLQQQPLILNISPKFVNGTDNSHAFDTPMIPMTTPTFDTMPVISTTMPSVNNHVTKTKKEEDVLMTKGLVIIKKE